MNVKTLEHGRFYAGPNGQRRFAGSASGVYLADTIRNRLPPHLGSDGGFVEAFISQLEGTVAEVDGGQRFAPYLLTADQLSDVPELQIRFKQYFADWHKLFPFIDGKGVKDMFAQVVHNAKDTRLKGESGGSVFGAMSNGDALVNTAILRAIFSIGGSGRAAPALTPELPVYQNADQATQLAHVLVGACDSYSIDHIQAIQGIFAVALSLYCARWFRPASHLVGTLVKLVQSAGLHRCPDRYPTTFDSAEERDIRKRLFYSIYVLDRLASKQLGLPLLLRDVDIDVCLPGADEIHGPKHAPAPSYERIEDESGPSKRRRTVSVQASTVDSPTPIHPSNPNQTPEGAIDTPAAYTEARVSSNSFRLLPAFTLARLAGIMGRIMETFNGSRRWRAADPEHAARIRTDLDEWWLDFELDMQDNNHLGNDLDPRAKYATLFRCLYNQQIMHMHRHSLSLPINSDAHRYALQAETLAARTICASLGGDNALSMQTQNREILWPGYPDMLFDASSVLVYATKVPSRLTEKRACSSLQQANLALGRLEAQWPTIRPVAVVIRDLERHLDPKVEETTQTTPTTIPLDWLLGSAFNLEANPSGPDLFPGMMAGAYSDMGLDTSGMSAFGQGNAMFTTLAPGHAGLYQPMPTYSSYTNG